MSKFLIMTVQVNSTMTEERLNIDSLHRGACGGGGFQVKHIVTAFRKTFLYIFLLMMCLQRPPVA